MMAVTNASDKVNSFAAKVPNAAASATTNETEPATVAVQKKDPFDRTSTKRSQRLAAEMKKTGGSTVVLRLKTSTEVAQLDALVADQVGRDRSDVLRKLITEKYKERQGIKAK